MPPEILDMLKLFPAWRAYGQKFFHDHPDAPRSNPIWRPGMPAPMPPPPSGAPKSVVGFRAEMRVARPGITDMQIEAVRRRQTRTTGRARVPPAAPETPHIHRSFPDCVCGKCNLQPSKRRRWGDAPERHCPLIPSPCDIQQETVREDAERRRADIAEQLLSLEIVARAARFAPLATRIAVARTHPARKLALQQQLRAVSVVQPGPAESAECVLSLPPNPDPVWNPKTHTWNPQKQNWNYTIVSFSGMAAAHLACWRAATLISARRRGVAAPGWRCHRCGALDPGALLALRLRLCGVHPRCGCGCSSQTPAACSFNFTTRWSINECDDCRL